MIFGFFIVDIFWFTFAAIIIFLELFSIDYDFLMSLCCYSALWLFGSQLTVRGCIVLMLINFFIDDIFLGD